MTWMHALPQATLVIGLALQSTLGNVASGVMMIVFRPFRVGDYVETVGGNGVVEEIGIFSTTMRTGDNKRIIVPNGSITGATVTNHSAKPSRRVDLVCRPWVQTPDHWAVRTSMLKKVELAFDEAGIPIPFPQREVHVHQVA